MVDATQGIAAFPHRAHEGEVLVFSGYKWLTAGYGAAAMVLPGGWPEGGSPLAGWRSQQDPYELENGHLRPFQGTAAVEAGHPPFAAVFAMGAAAALWNGYTPERAAARISGLVKRLHDGVGQGRIALSSTQDPDRLSGIVMLGVPDPEAAAVLFEALVGRQAGVIRELRESFLEMPHVDIEDALVCALLAHLFTHRPEELEPPGAGIPEAEGWIWVPKG